MMTLKAQFTVTDKGKNTIVYSLVIFKLIFWYHSFLKLKKYKFLQIYSSFWFFEMFIFYSSKKNKNNINESIEDDISESLKQSRDKMGESSIPDLIEGSAPEPKIKEFKINDQVSEESLKEIEDEHEETIQSSIYESVEKSNRLKLMADQKYGVKERIKIETESSIPEEPIKSISKPPKDKNIVKKNLKHSKTDLDSNNTKDLNKSEVNQHSKHFQEFNINDAGSKVGYEGFSESKN